MEKCELCKFIYSYHSTVIRIYRKMKRNKDFYLEDPFEEAFTSHGGWTHQKSVRVTKIKNKVVLSAILEKKNSTLHEEGGRWFAWADGDLNIVQKQKTDSTRYGLMVAVVYQHNDEQNEDAWIDEFEEEEVFIEINKKYRRIESIQHYHNGDPAHELEDGEIPSYTRFISYLKELFEYHKKGK